VTLIVNDGHGNTGTCSATVTVTDNISPTLFCKNATIYLNASGQATLTVAQVNNGSYDNCSITVLVLGQTTFTCANIGNNYVTLRGIDQSNNRGQCIATVTVIDPIAPTARCKNVAANLGANGSVTVPATSVDNGSTDNCSYTLTLSPNTFTCGNIGLNTVTLKATDAGGNAATCTAKVTIRDLATPKALCKNVTIYLDDNGQGSITASQLDNNSTDNCGITTRTININTFNCSNIDSPQPVTLTLRDGSNNQSTCQAMVTVKDNLAPTAVCENTTVQLNSQGQAVVYTSNLTDGSFDNCSVYATTPSAKVYTSANIGINYLTLTVKDWSGNGSTCVAQITVTPQGMAGGGGLASKTDLEPNDEAATDRVITAPTADFRIFPNPSPGKAVVEMFFEDELDFSLRVFDALGRLISDQKVKSQVGENRVELDLKNLPSGWYQVQIESAYFRKSKGLVIERL
jgi:hypothetical protein